MGIVHDTSRRRRYKVVHLNTEHGFFKYDLSVSQLVMHICFVLFMMGNFSFQDS